MLIYSNHYDITSGLGAGNLNYHMVIGGVFKGSLINQTLSTDLVATVLHDGLVTSIPMMQRAIVLETCSLQSPKEPCVYRGNTLGVGTSWKGLSFDKGHQ